jgi:hypothetical protein
VTYKLAKDGELPEAFGVPISHSREGLVISGILVIILALLFDLSEIAAIGAISVLFVHAVTHIGHLRIISKTGASYILVVFAIILCLAAMVLALIYVSKQSSQVGFVLLGFLAIAASTEFILKKTNKREVKPRI